MAERQASLVSVDLERLFPAYCAVKASMPDVTPSVEPRVRCDKQPVTAALALARYP